MGNDITQASVSTFTSPLVVFTQHNIDHIHETDLHGSDSGQQVPANVHSTAMVPHDQKRLRTQDEINERRTAAIKRRSLLEELRQSQKEALICLEGTTLSTIVVMPTGSGKTRLIWTFKHTSKCTLVFAPYAILAEQLQIQLNEKGYSVPWPLNTTEVSIEGVLARAEFIVLPYEAALNCRWLVTGLNRIGRLGPIFVDEVSM